jgi:hypothetical protein
MLTPDYHETEGAMGLVYGLGRVSIEWNMVEQFFTVLIWRYVGDDLRIGMAITSNLGNQSRADVLIALARQHQGDPELLERVEFACKAFNILRENRNMLMHSHSIHDLETGKKPIWVRATGRGPKGHATVEADVADLENIVSDLARLGMFAVYLTEHVRPFGKRRRKRGPLPEIFPLPRKLSPPPPEAPKDAPPPPQSSGG